MQHSRVSLAYMSFALQCTTLQSSILQSACRRHPVHYELVPSCTRLFKCAAEPTKPHKLAYSPEDWKHPVQGFLVVGAHCITQSHSRVLAHGVDVVVQVADPEAV